MLTKSDGGPAIAVRQADAAEPAATQLPVLLQYFRAVLRHKFIILGIVAAAIIVGLILSLIVTPKYTAVSRLEISRTQNNITNVQGVEQSDRRQDVEFYQTQYALLESRSLAERVVREGNFAANDAFFQALGVDPAAEFDGEPAAGRSSDPASPRFRMATDLLLRNVSIAPIRGSSLVDVGFVSSDPALSARVVNTWTGQFIAATLDRRFSSTADARKFLENRLSDLRARLEQSERDLVSYATNKEIISLGQGAGPDGRVRGERTLVAANLEALNTELADAVAARVLAESAVRNPSRSANAAALTNTAINGLRESRGKLAADYAKLMNQFEPEYPAAQALQSQIAALDQAIGREETRVSQSVTTAYRQALQREQDLRRRVEASKGGLLSEQRNTIQYNIYQREVDTNRALYDGLLQRYKEIGVAGVNVNNISIVDPAVVPKKPTSPKLSLNLALALLLGLFISGAVVVGLEQIDESIRDPEDVARLGVPLLGSVPNVPGEEIVTTIRDPKSTVSEAYMSVQTNLSFLTEHGIPKSLMMTSTREAEGKSTSAIALATLLSRMGRRVMLIDADMRSPSVDSMLSVGNELGLSNYLSGTDDWRSLVKSVEALGLDFITTGPMPPNSAELLSTHRMGSLIEALTEHYDVVIIDSPPVLGLADAPLIATTCEGVVYAIEANRVKSRGIATAMDRLRRSNAQIFGAILTKLDKHALSFGYGYGYGHGYGYGKEGREGEAGRS